MRVKQPLKWGVRVQFQMLITAATYTNPIEAHIVRGRLECEGIVAFVSHEHHIWAKWSLSQALGGVKVQVASSNMERASSVISDINSGKFIESVMESGLEEDHINCHRCQSNQVSSLSWPWKLSLVSLFFLLIPLPYTTKLVKCDACKFTWINNQDRPYPLISLSIVLIAVYIGIWLLVTGAFYLCKVNQLSNVCI